MTQEKRSGLEKLRQSILNPAQEDKEKKIQ